MMERLNCMTATVLTLRPKAGRFDAYLDGQLICTSKQPLLDGARELLRRGHDPAALLTTRHDGKGYDNFVPALIGELAKWAVEENDAGVKFRRHRPWPGNGHAQMRESGKGATTLPGIEARATTASCRAAAE
jgi:hypothetical protein